MAGRLARRSVLGTVAAGAGALLLGARGGIAAATSGGGRNGGRQATPVAEASPMEVGRMTAQTSNELWGRWADLWNGDLAVADEIVAPGFVAHFPPAGNSPSEVRGPEGLKGWIGGVPANFPDYSFATTVGPLADGDMVAGRWVFRATYAGGIPGASEAAVGRPVEYEGADFLRVEDGKIVEYWLSADILVLLQQVGMIPS